MQLDRRELRALALIALGGQIQRLDDSVFIVKSQSGSAQYFIRWEEGRWTCECQDFQGTGKSCKHVHAIRWVMAMPSVVVRNSAAVSGAGNHNTNPCLVYRGRSIPMCDLVDTYRRALDGLSNENGINLPWPALPRLRFKRRESLEK